MLSVSGLILVASLTSTNPKETPSTSVPKVCVQPADKKGRPVRDNPPVKVQPHCPNPEIVRTPTKRRRVPK